MQRLIRKMNDRYTFVIDSNGRRKLHSWFACLCVVASCKFNVLSLRDIVVCLRGASFKLIAHVQFSLIQMFDSSTAMHN